MATARSMPARSARARELTLRFRCQGALSTVQACPAVLPPGQKKPAVNSEGAYEDFETAAEDPDNREGVRATAYASALSGSLATRLRSRASISGTSGDLLGQLWNDQSKADGDLSRMGGLFRGAPWTILSCVEPDRQQSGGEHGDHHAGLHECQPGKREEADVSRRKLQLRTGLCPGDHTELFYRSED